jgi:hypothetical protein
MNERKRSIVALGIWLTLILGLILVTMPHSRSQIRTPDGRIARMQKWPENNKTANIDLESYSRGRNKGVGRRKRFVRCPCNMCDNIYGWKAEYMSQGKSMKSAARHSATVKAADAIKAALKEVGQSPTPSGHMDTGIRIADIGPYDTVGEFGCGIAEWSIRAVESGAKRAYGFEIDIDMVKKARQHVQEAVVAGRIAAGSVIVQHRDVRDVDPSKYHISIGLAYLYPELLTELMVAGKFAGLSKVVSPYHEIEGLDMVEHDEVWLWTDDPADQPVKRSFHTFVPMTVSAPVLTEEVKAHETPVLLFYHFDGCAACRQWTANERSKMTYEVIDRGTREGRKNGVGLYPAFQVGVLRDGEYHILHDGPTVASPKYQWGYRVASVFNRLLAGIERDLNPQDSQKTMSASMVSVRVHARSSDGNGDAGSGTVVKSEGGVAYILTCAHVFRKHKTLSVYDPNTGTEYPAEMVALLPTPTDLAILKVTGNTTFIAYAPLANEVPPTGSPLVSYGFDHAGPQIRSDCKLLSINKFTGPSSLVCSGRHATGRSGGGLFTPAGELLGVCSGMFSPDSGIFTGLSEIRSLMKSIQ